MRVAGDSDGCRAVARALRRSAALTGRGAGEQRATAALPHWNGRSADARADLAVRRADSGSAAADRLAAAAGALERHADGLEELQSRARRLVDRAADAGLHLDACGWIPRLPLGPEVDPVARAQAEHRAAVRAEVLRAVAELQSDVELLHARTATSLPAGCGAAPTGSAFSWAPARTDLVGVPMTGVEVAAQVGQGHSRAAAAVAGSTKLVPFVGGALGTATDMAQGMSAPEAAAKNTVTTAAGVGASAGFGGGAAALGVGMATPAGPAIAVGVAAVGAGAAVSWGVGKLWDRFTEDDPDARRCPSPRTLPQPPPRPGARRQPTPHSR